MKIPFNDSSAEITYYIDESGNTGDLILGGDDLNFGGQPYFGLGCVGVIDEEAFNRDIDALKKKHRIQAVDIKSTKIYKKKPGFILDLVRLISGRSIPFFIELVEKRFFVATNIAYYLVLPPYFCEADGAKADYIRNVFAQFIARLAPNEVFNSYFRACQSQIKADLMEAFRALVEFGNSGGSMLHQNLVESVEESMDDFSVMLQQEGSEEKAVRRFLPIPDVGKKGKEVWILPNYSSLTNLYARINFSHGGKIQRVKLVHDEQAQFDEILTLAKRAVEDMQPERQVSDIADYKFIEQAGFRIAGSESCIGIQVADVLTGFVVRYAQDKMVKGIEPARELVDAFHLMVEAECPVKGYGINYVWSYNVLE